MPRYTVPYTHVNVPPSPAFPKRRKTPRPIVPVILSQENRLWPCYALLDSGADDCLFPASFAPRIGLDYVQGAGYEFAGAGSADQPARFFDIGISIGTVITYRARIGFTPALDAAGIGLLGQHGFFDRFKVEFDLPNDVFHIEE